VLTPWEKELNMLEDWLNHLKPVNDCHEETVMQIAREENSKKLLKNFIQEAEQEMTARLKHAVEYESKFQSGE
jgi:hypothetical protein